MGKNIIMFDLDGTVTAQETLPIIAQKLGIADEIEKMTQETIAGRIPFVESFITRVNLLKKYSVKTVRDIITQAPTHMHILRFMKEHREFCRIVTGNLDCWVTGLVAKIDCPCSCSVAYCERDRLVKIKSILNKAEVVKSCQNKGYRVIFIGEGNNDADAIRIADVGIAFGAVHSPSNSTLEVASHVVFDEERLCSFLKQLL